MTRRGSSRTVVVDPPGKLREVDTAPAVRQMRRIAAGGWRGRRELDRVLDAPHRVLPIVLHVASDALLAADRPERAAFLYYAGQLRARYDAARCTDPTAASAHVLLRERFGVPVNQWAMADPRRVRRAAITAVVWDRGAPHDYDHRWIALHGMTAFGPQSGPVSVPVAEWPALAARGRAEFLAGLRQVVRARFGPRP